MEQNIDECLLSQSKSRKTFDIVSPVLDPSKEDEWIISDGEQTLTVTIEDKNFLEAVRSGEIVFVAGSTILADLEIVHRITKGGVLSSYQLTEVITVTDQ